MSEHGAQVDSSRGGQIEVIRPGMLTTVQDWPGRIGYSGQVRSPRSRSGHSQTGLMPT